MSTTPNTVPLSFEELRTLSQKARNASAKARAAKRNHRLYLQLASALDQLVSEHTVLVGLAHGLVAQLSERDKLERAAHIEVSGLHLTESEYAHLEEHFAGAERGRESQRGQL